MAVGKFLLGRGQVLANPIGHRVQLVKVTRSLPLKPHARLVQAVILLLEMAGVKTNAALRSAGSFLSPANLLFELPEGLHEVGNHFAFCSQKFPLFKGPPKNLWRP